MKNTALLHSVGVFEAKTWTWEMGREREQLAKAERTVELLPFSLERERDILVA